MSNFEKGVLLVLIQVVPLALGWRLKEKGIAKASWAKPLSRFIIYFFNTGVCFLAAWYLKREPGVAKLPIISAAFGLGMTVAGAIVARVHRSHSGLERGVYIIGSALSNYGFTLGGFICLIYIGQDALSMQTIYLMPLVGYIFLVWFPIGRHYGTAEKSTGLLRTFLRTFTDVTSLPLAGAAAGLVLNFAVGPQRSEFLSWTKILFVYGGTLASMFCIGLTLKLDSVLDYKLENASIFAVKFMIGPLIGYGLATALGVTGQHRQVIVIMSCMPVGIFTSFSASLFGLNRDLANSLFVVNTCAFLALVLPILVWMLKYVA